MSDKDVDTALERAGFQLVRQGKHLVYKNAAGKTVTISKTPSDWRASFKVLRDIKRELNPATPAGAAIDVELPKQQKKGAARGHAASTFDFYTGMAPHSVPATEEETIKALQGYLRSRDAYQFKSEFTKEIVKLAERISQTSREDIRLCVRDFEKMRRFFESAIRRPDDPPPFPDVEEGNPYGCFAHFLEMAAEIAADATVPSDEDTWELLERNLDNELMWELLRRGFEHEALDKAYALDFKKRLLDLSGRVANHILRGDSAAEIRAFIESRLQAMEWEPSFDVCELFEQIAIEKLVKSEQR
jgi:predicted RNA binding protein YcfA (HicA-like mRNA interferase family)